MRALLVVNPSATSTTPRGVDVLADALGSEVKLDVAPTGHRGHARELAAQAALDGLDLVVALGGDGTVNEVVNGLLADGPRGGLPALAVVPGGSTNVFARALGVPAGPVEATGTLLEALRSERRRRIGLGVADGHWFTFSAGLGLDAEVVRLVEARRAGGRRASAALFLGQTLRHFFTTAERRHPPLTLEHPGAAPQQLFLAAICNTSPWTYLGERAVRPCPAASFDTGLDVFGLRRLGTPGTLRHLAQILAEDPRPRGRHLSIEHDLQQCTVTAQRPLPFQADGEDLGDRSQVTFHSVPDALDVIA